MGGSGDWKGDRIAEGEEKGPGFFKFSLIKNLFNPKCVQTYLVSLRERQEKN